MSEQIRPAIYRDQDDQILPDTPAALGGGSPGACAPTGFPFVTGTPAITQITTNSTSHTVNLPTGISSGELLLMIIGMDGTTTASATGWTSVTTAASTGNASVGVLYRFADGSEGSTVTVTTSASEQLTAWVGRIDDAHASTPPEGTSAGVGTAESQHSSGSLTPSWGADDDLWFSVTIWDGSATAGITLLAQPLQYFYVYHLANANTTTVGIGIAQRYLNAASEDPTRFVIDASEQYAHATVAVRPV